MVGVAIVQGIGQYDFRLATADDLNDFLDVFGVVLEKAVGHVQIDAEGGPHELGGFGGFAGADFGGASGAEFAPGKVEQAYGFALGDVAEQGATAGKFYVIGMNADGKDVDFHTHSFVVDKNPTTEVMG